LLWGLYNSANFYYNYIGLLGLEELMVDINDDIMNMPKGWIVHYDDGRIITEYTTNGKQRDWRDVPKVNIKSLSLKWHNRFWTLHGKGIYLQKKRGWIIPVQGVDMEPNIQYRFIGYWEGDNKVYYRVDEHTGQMLMVVEDGAGK